MVHLSQVDVITLFPQIFRSWLEQGVVSRAVERGLVNVVLTDLRPFGVGRHHVTDDYPFGGGPGMVMKPEPLFAAVEALNRGSDVPVILLSPHGRIFKQAQAEQLSRLRRFVLVAGHYEGIDERVRQHLVDDELSIGDFVLSCGELAAMVVVDTVVRLLPGALAEGSASEESFSQGLLEHPHYTRPAEFRGWSVPEVLLSGHHERVARWRREQSILRTVQRRPDLLEQADLTPVERAAVLESESEKI
ncbi:MAG TPA: tRNA (guanosine(37)-N1)-methyltransferase TrmD [Chloroflexota bacterium]